MVASNDTAVGSPKRSNYGSITETESNSLEDLNNNTKGTADAENLKEAEKGATIKQVFQLYWHEVLTYWLSFGTFGLCIGFLGPTLWDLSCQTGTVLPSMAWLFGSQTVFILVGSFATGLVLKVIPAHFVLLIAEVGVVATIISVPSCSAGVTLGIVLAVMGLSMGLIDTTGNVCMISLFGGSVGPMLMTLHFCYSLGALAAPLIVEPFLLSFDCTQLILNVSANAAITLTASDYGFDELVRNRRKSEEDLQLIRDQERVALAFYIMELLQIPMLLSILCLILRRRYGCTDATTTAVHAGGNTSAEKSSMCTSVVTVILAVCCLLLFVSDGLQSAFSGFIFTFSQLEIHGLSPQVADFISAAFWAGFALGRFGAIFASFKFSPIVILLISNVGLVASTVFMCADAHHVVVLSLGTTLFGLSLSAISPCIILAAEQLLSLSPIYTSLLVVMASLGETTYPLILGNFITADDPETFLYCVGSSVVVFVLLFLVLLLLTAKHHIHNKQCARKELCPLPRRLEKMMMFVVCDRRHSMPKAAS